MQETSAHKNYYVEWAPRRNRLTHNLAFEQFQMALQQWAKLEQQYKQNDGKLKEPNI